MAVVTRYFSTTAAGAADGTTWADRAALFSAGNWSAVITGFAFNASDSLLCLIGPGSYTCSQALASGLFANPPSAANNLFLHGCDSSGTILDPPDRNWLSCEPDWSDSTLPVIATTTNIATLNLANANARLLKFTASGRNSAMIAAGNVLDWSHVVSTTAHASAACVAGMLMVTNSVLSCSGSSYDFVLNVAASADNVRVKGVTGSSGDRDGIEASSNTPNDLSRVTVFGHGGNGIQFTGTGTGFRTTISTSVVANNGGKGVELPSTASQTVICQIDRCMITGNVTGVDAQTAARLLVTSTRLRDNTTNLTGLGNFPDNFSNYTTDSDDATEYVDASTTFDFTIKSGAAIHGMGFGVAEQASAGGSGIGALCGGSLVR